MSRRGSVGRRLSPRITDVKLMSEVALASLTFARSGEAAQEPTASPISWAADGVLRTNDRGRIMLEGSRTNQVTASRDLTSATAYLLAAQGTPTVTAAYGTGPDGTSTISCRVQLSGSAPQTSKAFYAPVASNVRRCFSNWRKATSGTSPYSADCGWSNGLKIAITSINATWTKQILGSEADSRYYWTPAGATASNGGSLPQDVEVDLIQCEEGVYFPSRAIRTSGSTATRAADSLTATSSQVPSALWSKTAFFAAYAPEFVNAETNNGEKYWLLSIAGSSDGIYLDNTSGTLTIKAVQGGAVKATSPSITITRDTSIGEVRWNPSSAIISVNGVAGSAGTPWTWSPGNVRIGGIQGGSGSEAYGSLSPKLVILG